MKARWIPWAAFAALLAAVGLRSVVRVVRDRPACSIEVVSMAPGRGGDTRVVVRLLNRTARPLQCLAGEDGRPLLWVVPMEVAPGPERPPPALVQSYMELPPGSPVVVTQSVPAAYVRFRITANPRPDPRRYRVLNLLARVSPRLAGRLWPDPILVSTPELVRKADGQTL